MRLNYPKQLKKMWKLAKAPREENAPTVISTFAGGGGSVTGYKMAGFDDLLAVEIEKNAVDTLRMNHPDLQVYHGDIANLSSEEVLKRTGLQVGELDVLDGSPPCQGFSGAGLRLVDDPRNFLFKEYARLLNDLRPKCFIMENVSGMVKGGMVNSFVEIIKSLKRQGYRVEARLMNTKYFHVPQSRPRLIFVGTRDDLPLAPSHPVSESSAIPFGEACAGVKRVFESRYVSHDYLKKYAQYHPSKKWVTQEKIYKEIKGNNAGWYGTLWASYGKTIGTITKTEISSSGIIHPNRKRYLDLCELKRCGSFPDEYQFLSRKDGVARIGNSVPPLFMEALSRHLRNNILGNPIKSPYTYKGDL